MGGIFGGEALLCGRFYILLRFLFYCRFTYLLGLLDYYPAVPLLTVSPVADPHTHVRLARPLFIIDL